MSKSIDEIKKLIDNNRLKGENFNHFVLEGGAGSGKTESLKEIISYISEKFPDLTIACITHTNVAADTIKSRVDNDKHRISTIHSFLNHLIKNFTKNIQEVLPEIFCLDNSAIIDHEDYKKRHEKLSKKKYQIEKLLTGKVIGKRDYDKNPQYFNQKLISEINLINHKIIELISKKDHSVIKYNETTFDSLEDLSFSHDSLLVIAKLLASKFNLFPKIISDKFDYIFIDEYQDTNPTIIKLFLESLPNNKNTTIGLFGDSMQGIYDDGVGDVQLYIDKGVIIKVDKEDNYRCSQQVIKFINQLRNDPIRQELALKENETVESRQGFVKLYVKKYVNKPHTRSSEEEKNSYLLELKKNISEIRKDMPDDLKILLLTNKSISKELGFENLYNIFNERYSDVKDEIEKELAKIQILDIVELIRLYHNKSYNELLLKFKKNGFYIKSIDDKNKLIASLNSLIELNLSLKETVDFCISNSLIKKTERASNYELNSRNFLQEFNSNVIFTQLEGYYEKGFNTVNRVNAEYKLDYDQQEFDDFLDNLKKKRFYKNLFSKDLKFNEVLHYFNYLNEEANYITMHKTKGSGIENVLVVLDEYFWSKYQFKSVYKKEQRSLFNQKLFYVSCSRAIKNLSILRFVENEDEETDLVNYFKNCEIIKT